MNPNRLKLTAVSTRKAIIHSGCSISYGTKMRAVTRISTTSTTDLVVAAPTNPTTHSPNKNPKRLKLNAVSTRKAIIHSGGAISYGTKMRAVTRISTPSTTDLVVAAPT